MKRQYQIIRESKGTKEVVSRSTRKRDIEKSFNLIMRIIRKDRHYTIIPKNIGYAIVTYIGEYGERYDYEYYITVA